MKSRERIIRNYIDAYNRFDINAMIKDFDSAIVFENFQKEVCTLSLKGIEEFKVQAEEASHMFSERKQTILTITHSKSSSNVEIEFWGKLAIDLPNGLKKTDELILQGISIFQFARNKIIRLTDKS